MPEKPSEQRMRDVLRAHVDQPRFIPTPPESLVRRVRRRQLRNGAGVLALVILVGIVGVRALPLADRSQTPARPTPTPLRGDGKIAFTLGTDLYMINPDGTGRTRVARGCTGETCLILHIAWSPQGTGLAFSHSSEKSFEVGPQDGPLYVIRSDGTDLRAITDCESPSCADGYASWSPDGSKIAFVRRLDGDRTLYVMNPDGSDLRRVSEPGVGFGSASWSPDGEHLAYLTDNVIAYGGGGSKIVVAAADGSSRSVVVQTSEQNALFSPTWSSSDPTLIYYGVYDSVRNEGDLWAVGTDGSHPHRVFSAGANRSVIQPAWSPDGRRFAVIMGRSVIVMNADGTERVQVARGRVSSDAVWSPSGTKLALILNGRLVIIPVNGGAEVIVTKVGDLGVTIAWQPVVP